MTRNTRLDYRCYQVEPPIHEHHSWCGTALLVGMPNLLAASEGELRRLIDYAHKDRG